MEFLSNVKATDAVAGLQVEEQEQELDQGESRIQKSNPRLADWQARSHLSNAGAISGEPPIHTYVRIDGSVGKRIWQEVENARR